MEEQIEDLKAEIKELLEVNHYLQNDQERHRIGLKQTLAYKMAFNYKDFKRCLEHNCMDAEFYKIILEHIFEDLKWQGINYDEV